MKRYNLLLICLFFVLTAQAQENKKASPIETKASSTLAKDSTNTKKADSAKKVSPYEKIFKNKVVKTKNGLITMHKIDGKVYFEFPKNLLNKPMLLSTVVESVSNSNDSFAGFQARTPLNVYFTQIDSSIYIKNAIYSNTFDVKDQSIKNALAKNSMDPVIATFKVLAKAPDSTSVVFDPTSFFNSSNRSMDPFKPVSGLNGRSTSFKADKSLLKDIYAYDDNIAISSFLSYSVSSTFFGFVTEENRPATIVVKRTLKLLPEIPMQPRLNDPRIGIAFTKQNKYSGNDNGISSIYFANRWNLNPKTAKPIIYYIDDTFPATWIPYIKEGIERWNDAFNALGYNNLIVTKIYPKGDPNFDPENIKYNCVKYSPSTSQDANATTWVDPRSGEILGATIYINQGILDKFSQDLFLQTAAADTRMRTSKIPMLAMGDVLRYTVMQKAGLTFGLLNNFSASSSVPVDSLRSVSYTKANGITPSVMDDALYNFVAQPGDFEKGVLMTQNKLGAYDLYAINWLYNIIKGAKTPEDETKTLDKLISEKIIDPKYRYSKISTNGIANPNAMADDLGDDKIKSIDYAYKNLKYVLTNMSDWVDKEDKDYSFRAQSNFAIINIKFYWYFTHVLSNIGGIYQFERYEGDPLKAYTVVPRDVQRNSMMYLLNVLENLNWVNDVKIESNMDAVNGDASDYMRKVLFPHVLRWVANIGYAQTKDPANSYSQEECIKDVFNYVWKDAADGKLVSPEKRSLQAALIQILITNSKINEIPGVARKTANTLSDDEISFYNMMASKSKNNFYADAEKVSAFGTAGRILYQNEDMSSVWFNWLLQNKTILEKLVQTSNGADKSSYQYFLLQINKTLDK